MIKGLLDCSQDHVNVCSHNEAAADSDKTALWFCLTKDLMSFYHYK